MADNGEPSDDSLTIVAPRKRGRPRAQVQSTAVMTWVPTTLHDKLIRIANKRDVSVSQLLKQIVVFQLDRPDRG